MAFGATTPQHRRQPLHCGSQPVDSGSVNVRLRGRYSSWAFVRYCAENAMAPTTLRHPIGSVVFVSDLNSNLWSTLSSLYGSATSLYLEFEPHEYRVRSWNERRGSVARYCYTFDTNPGTINDPAVFYSALLRSIARHRTTEYLEHGFAHLEGTPGPFDGDGCRSAAGAGAAATLYVEAKWSRQRVARRFEKQTHWTPGGENGSLPRTDNRASAWRAGTRQNGATRRASHWDSTSTQKTNSSSGWSSRDLEELLSLEKRQTSTQLLLPLLLKPSCGGTVRISVCPSAEVSWSLCQPHSRTHACQNVPTV